MKQCDDGCKNFYWANGELCCLLRNDCLKLSFEGCSEYEEESVENYIKKRIVKAYS